MYWPARWVPRPADGASSSSPPPGSTELPGIRSGWADGTSDLGDAAVDEQLDPGDEAGVAGREKERRGRDLLRPADGAARDHGDERLLRVIGEGLEDHGGDRTRTEEVHAALGGLYVGGIAREERRWG